MAKRTKAKSKSGKKKKPSAAVRRGREISSRSAQEAGSKPERSQPERARGNKKADELARIWDEDLCE